MIDERTARIQRELALISSRGGVKLIESPAAVIYYKLPSTIGVVEQTDVLVRIPDGYPSSMLDLAYLPEASPLLGVVRGEPQQIIQADGRSWKEVSYHPHNGGGGPQWDPSIHGFHTYIDELLTWLAHRR